MKVGLQLSIAAPPEFGKPGESSLARGGFAGLYHPDWRLTERADADEIERVALEMLDAVRAKVPAVDQ